MKRLHLYEQVETYLLHMVRENIGTPDFRFPSENQLVNMFNVSRITAKRALTNLTDEGLLYRKKGSGTYLAPGLTTEYVDKRFPREPAYVRPIGMGNKTMGVILPDLTSTFYTEILCGINDFAQAHGWNVMLGNTNNNQERETEFIKQFTESCNGLIICPCNYNLYNQQILRLSLKNYPIVLIDNNMFGINITYIKSDSFNTIYKAVEYFISQGKKNIGYITLPEKNNLSLEERKRGYEAALIDHDLRIHKEFILNSSDHTAIFTENKIRQFLNNNRELEAIVTANCGLGIQTVKDILATGTDRLLDNVIIFDDEFSKLKDLLLFRPKYIKQDTLKIGMTAAEKLVEKYDYPDTINSCITIPTELHFDD